MKIILAGSRDWTDKLRIYDCLYFLWALAKFKRQPFMMVHGDGRGADALGGQWGKRFLPEEHQRSYPADWDTHGKAAGPKRTETMWFVEHWLPLNAPHPKREAQEPVDLCVAFLLAGAANRGTGICIELAREHGVPVWSIPSAPEPVPDLPEEFRL